MQRRSVARTFHTVKRVSFNRFLKVVSIISACTCFIYVFISPLFLQLTLQRVVVLHICRSGTIFLIVNGDSPNSPCIVDALVIACDACYFIVAFACALLPELSKRN